MPGAPGSFPKPTSPGAPPFQPGKFNIAQIEGLWIRNGGSLATAPIAAAIAYAESKGDPNAINHNSDGSIDRGLFQINSVHGSQSTTNVDENVKAAIAISNGGTNWSPWTTFKSGAYKVWLPSAQKDAKMGSDALSNLVGGIASGIGSVAGDIGSVVTAPITAAEAIAKFVSFITDPQTWVRFTEIIAGAFLIFLGLRAMTGGSGDPVQAVKGAASHVKVVPIPV